MQQSAQVVVLMPTVHKELLVDVLLLVIREVPIAVKEGHHLSLRPLLEAHPVAKLRLASHEDKAVAIRVKEVIYVLVLG